VEQACSIKLLKSITGVPVCERATRLLVGTATGLSMFLEVVRLMALSIINASVADIPSTSYELLARALLCLSLTKKESIAIEYRRKKQLHYRIFPSPNIATL